MPNPTINIKNLNYIRTAQKGELKGHLVAESFDDINKAYGQLATVQQETAAQLAAALARIAKLEQA